MPTHEERVRSKRRRELGLAWCSACRQDKPWASFAPCPGRRPFGLASHCLECDGGRKAAQKRQKYWALTPDERRVFNRRQNIRRFGITLDDYEERFKAQRGVCAICRKPESVEHHSTNEVQPLVVDHDHDSGAVRGLLCTRCNKGIGLLMHRPEVLEAAAAYLRGRKRRRT